MAKNRIYDTAQETVSGNYIEKIKLEPSGMTLSLDVIIEDAEKIMQSQENQEHTSREDTL